MTNETDTLLGTTLKGRWRITRKLGEGGMGAVYKAEGLAGEGEFAVKFLHKEFVNEEQVVSRFYAEAEASKRLIHPNIARIYESGTAETGEPFLLMELLRGQALADACPEGQRMPVEEAVVIMKEVLIALDAAHKQDIVHRDLKPDNIYLCDVDGKRVAKLLDFGIARVIDAAQGGAMRKTKTGMLLGTPGYMSPEQLRNSKSVDPRSDLWSLCTVFYELLSGRDPYGATNDFARLTAVFTQESIPIDRDVPELANWRAFFQRAFMRDINQRYQSAIEMSAAIDAIMSGQPLPAPHAPQQPPAQAPQQQTVTQASPQKQPIDALASTQLAGFTAPQIPVQPQAQTQAQPQFQPQTQPQPQAQTPAPITPAPATTPAPTAASSNKLVWALIAVVLALGTVITVLAVRSLTDDKKQGASPQGSSTAPASTKPQPGGKKTPPPT